MTSRNAGYRQNPYRSSSRPSTLHGRLGPADRFNIFAPNPVSERAFRLLRAG